MKPGKSASVAPCPACSGLESCVLQTIETAPQHRNYAKGDEAIARLLDSALPDTLRTIQVSRCTRCELEFASPLLSPGPDWYGALYCHTELYPTVRWEFEEVLNRLTTGEKVFDIGCGDGAFLDRASRCGLKATGGDFAASSISQAQSRGLNVVQLPEHLGQVNDIPDDFDVVTAFHVIEHLEDPKSLLAFAARISKPAATLQVAVPSNMRPTRRAGLRDYLDEPPHHLSRWTANALAAVAKSTGWNLEAIHYEPMEFKTRLWWAMRNSLTFRGLSRLGLARSAASERICRVLSFPEALGSIMLGNSRRTSGFSMLATYTKDAEQ